MKKWSKLMVIFLHYLNNNGQKMNELISKNCNLNICHHLIKSMKWPRKENESKIKPMKWPKNAIKNFTQI